MRSNRWAILAVLTLARTAMGYQFQSIGSLSPFLVENLEIEFAEIGILIGLFMLPGVVISLPGGILSRWFGDKSVVLGGLAMMAVGGVVVAAGADLSTAVVGRIISGAGAVILNIVLTKMTADWFDEKELVTAMALLVTSWPLGIGLGLLTQGLVAQSFGWPAAMATTSIASAIALVLVWLTYTTPSKVADVPTEGRGLLAGISGREVYLVSLAGLIWMLFNVGYILVVSFTPAFLTETGSSIVSSASVTSLATWTLIISVPLGGLIIGRFKYDTLITFISLLVMSGAMLVLPFVSVLAMVVVVGIAAGPPAGAIMALAARVLLPQNRNAGMGIYFTWYYVGMAALPFFAGLARDISDNPAGPFIFGGALLTLSAAILLALKVSNRSVEGVAV